MTSTRRMRWYKLFTEPVDGWPPWRGRISTGTSRISSCHAAASNNASTVSERYSVGYETANRSTARLPNARNPLVVSVTATLVRRDTIRASHRMHRRRRRPVWNPAANREPTTMSTPSSRGAINDGAHAGSCCPSASSCSTIVYPRSAAYRKPLRSAAPTPRLNGCESTNAPAAWAISAVRSVEPSSTTRTSATSRSRAPRTTAATVASSFSAGMTTSSPARALTLSR